MAIAAITSVVIAAGACDSGGEAGVDTTSTARRSSPSTTADGGPASSTTAPATGAPASACSVTWEQTKSAIVLGVTTDRPGVLSVRTTSEDGGAGPQREISILDEATNLRVEMATTEEIRTVTGKLGDVACSVEKAGR